MAATIDIVAKFTDQATAGIQGLGKTLSGAVTQAAAPITQLTTAMEGLATRAIQPIAAVAPGLAGAIGGLATAMGPLGVAAIAAGAGFTALVAGMAETTKRFSEQADAIGELATRTGVAVPTLSALRIAAEQSGTSIDAVGAAIGRMQQSLTTASGVTTQTKAALDAFGVTVEQLRAMTPEQQFQTLASAIAQMPDPAQRTATAMDIFGKSAGALLPLLLEIAQEGIGGFITQAQDLNAVISTESAKAADEYQDALVELDAGFKGLQAVIAKAFLPAMRDIAEEAVKVIKDLIEFEKQTGLLSGAVKAIGTVLKNTIPEIAALAKAIATLIDWIGKAIDVLSRLGDAVSRVLGPAIDAVGRAVGAITTAITTMIGAIERAGSVIGSLADKARALVQVLTGGSLDDSLQIVAEGIEDLVRASGPAARGFEKIATNADDLIEKLEEIEIAARRAGLEIVRSAATGGTISLPEAQRAAAGIPEPAAPTVTPIPPLTIPGPPSGTTITSGGRAAAPAVNITIQMTLNPEQLRLLIERIKYELDRVLQRRQTVPA
jgi:uncharacterized phage infection (PIP) family protein YhgE